jgi:hypothetical protein
MPSALEAQDLSTLVTEGMQAATGRADGHGLRQHPPAIRVWILHDPEMELFQEMSQNRHQDPPL